jgi:hypothetical protein
MDGDGQVMDSVPSQRNVTRVGNRWQRIKMVDVEIALGDDPTPVSLKFLFPLLYVWTLEFGFWEEQG